MIINSFKLHLSRVYLDEILKSKIEFKMFYISIYLIIFSTEKSNSLI